MLQDVEAKRQTEIEVINGAIVDAGRRANVADPAQPDHGVDDPGGRAPLSPGKGLGRSHGIAARDRNALSKFFPGVRALDNVSMSVDAGEIRALLGENGAGKSTLGKIVAGVYSRDQGTIWFDGAEIGALDEKAAGDLGIGIVHQEGSLVPQLSIAENIFAGRQPTQWLGQVNVRLMRERGKGARSLNSASPSTRR